MSSATLLRLAAALSPRGAVAPVYRRVLMRTASRAALAGMIVATAACSRTPGPAPPPEATPPARSACVAAAGGHVVCGALVGPAARVSADAGHAARGGVDAGASAVESAGHRITQAAVTP